MYGVNMSKMKDYFYACCDTPQINTLFYKCDIKKPDFLGWSRLCNNRTLPILQAEVYTLASQTLTESEKCRPDEKLC